MKNKKKEKRNRPDSFLYDGLSIDETRISVLMISYIICFLVTLWFFTKEADGEGLKAIFFSNIAAVTGMSITNTITNKFSEDTTDDDQNDTPKG